MESDDRGLISHLRPYPTPLSEERIAALEAKGVLRRVKPGSLRPLTKEDMCRLREQPQRRERWDWLVELILADEARKKALEGLKARLRRQVEPVTTTPLEEQGLEKPRGSSA